MKILAIESAGMTAGVALLENNTILSDYAVSNKKTHSQTLLPMIETICHMTDTTAEELEAIAVSAGPGSFTGLRIGAATAKGIGLARDIPLLSVPTMAALAANLWGKEGLICPMMDARRKTVYTGLYRYIDGEQETVLEQTVLPIEELIAIINKKKEKVTFLGDCVAMHEALLEETLHVPFEKAPAHLMLPMASSTAVLGAKLYERGKAIPAAEFAPIYLRMTQAERERLEKEKTKS